jgi:hypothetical protein
VVKAITLTEPIESQHKNSGEAYTSVQPARYSCDVTDLKTYTNCFETVVSAESWPGFGGERLHATVDSKDAR